MLGMGNKGQKMGVWSKELPRWPCPTAAPAPGQWPTLSPRASTALGKCQGTRNVTDPRNHQKKPEPQQRHQEILFLAPAWCCITQTAHLGMPLPRQTGTAVLP